MRLLCDCSRLGCRIRATSQKTSWVSHCGIFRQTCISRTSRTAVDCQLVTEIKKQIPLRRRGPARETHPRHPIQNASAQKSWRMPICAWRAKVVYVHIPPHVHMYVVTAAGNKTPKPHNNNEQLSVSMAAACSVTPAALCSPTHVRISVATP